MSEEKQGADKRLNNSQLINKAQAICACLSYDNDTPNGSSKAMIRELCGRLGARTVTIDRKDGGYIMRALFGEARYLSLFESIMWRLFAWPPRGFEILRGKSSE